MNDTRPLDARQWLKLAAALFVLNAALTLQNVWPTLWVRLRPEVSIELGVLLLVLVVWTSFVAPLGRKTLAGLTVLMLVLLIGRYAEVTSPALYGRPVNLYWDSQHLPNVAAMLAKVGPWWLVGLLVLGSAALLTALVLGLAWCLATVTTSLRSTTGRRVLGGIAGLLVAGYAIGQLSDGFRAPSLFVAGHGDLSAASAVCRRRGHGRSESRLAGRAVAAVRSRSARR